MKSTGDEAVIDFWTSGQIYLIHGSGWNHRNSVWGRARGCLESGPVL